MKKLLEVKELNKSYGDVEILKNINLEIESGKIIGLLGRNGAGKTTLIKLINGLLTITSGEILVNGEPVGVKSKSIISYLPERTFLNKSMTIKEAVKHFGKENFVVELLEEVENAVDMDDREIFWIKKYSATSGELGYNVSEGGEGCAQEHFH